MIVCCCLSIYLFVCLFSTICQSLFLFVSPYLSIFVYPLFFLMSISLFQMGIILKVQICQHF